MIDSDLNLPLEAIRDLCRRHHISELALFGSAVTDNFTLRSDVDLLVKVYPGRSLLDVGGFLMDMQDLFERKVDVLTDEGLKPRIREQVLREAVEF